MSPKRRTAARSLAVLALAVPTAAALVAAAPPALAADGFVEPSPAEGAVVVSGASIDVKADITLCLECYTLTVTGPGGGLRKSTGSALGATSVTVSVPTGGGRSVPNGSAWKAVLARNGMTVATRAFRLAYPVSTPTGLSAAGTGSRQVALTWDLGPEPDLTSYTLADESGALQTGIRPADHCTTSTSSAPGTCRYGITYPTDRPGSHSYSLTAYRPGAGSADPALASDVARADATLASRQSTPGPSSGGTSGASGGATPGTGTAGAAGNAGGTSRAATGGSSSTASGRTPTSRGSASGRPGMVPTLPADGRSVPRPGSALTLRGFAPSLGVPPLPPLPTTTAPTIAGTLPLPLGTFTPSLPYGSTTRTVAEPPVRGLSAVTRSVANVLDSAQLARSISVALLLLLVAGHVRRFLGASPDA